MRTQITPLFIPLVLLLLFFPQAASGAVVCLDCHDRNLFTNNVVHEPVREEKCTRCHNPHVARHEGLLMAREGKLCYSCHDQLPALFTRGHVHEPVADGKCTVCHDPHAAAGASLVNDDLARSCLICHEKLPTEFRYVHAPFRNGACMECHLPHNSEQQGLLKAEADGLCLSCHQPESMEAGHKNFPHTPAKCLTCHNPHGSDRPSLVRNVLHPPFEKDCATCHGPKEMQAATCLDCHQGVYDEMMRIHSHLTRQDGNSCLNCHSPHAGDDERLLRGPLKQLCVSCHMAVIEGYRLSTYKHPAMQNCGDCHEPHASNTLSMLKGDGIEVCARCHESQGAFSHPIGEDVIDERTGQAMTCVTCHNPMGTEFAFHLLDDRGKGLCILCHKNY